MDAAEAGGSWATLRRRDPDQRAIHAVVRGRPVVAEYPYFAAAVALVVAVLGWAMAWEGGAYPQDNDRLYDWARWSRAKGSRSRPRLC